MNRYEIVHTKTLGKKLCKSADGRRLEIHEIAYEGFDFLPGQFVMIQIASRNFEWAYPYLILCKSDSGFKVTAAARTSLYGMEPGTSLVVWGANGRGIQTEPSVTLVAEAATIFLTAPFLHAAPNCSMIFIGKKESVVSDMAPSAVTVVSSCDEASSLLAKTEGAVIMALNYPTVMEVMAGSEDRLKERTQIFASTPMACGVNACKGCYLHSPDLRSGFPVCCEGPYLPYNRIDFVTDEKCFHHFQ